MKYTNKSNQIKRSKRIWKNKKINFKITNHKSIKKKIVKKSKKRRKNKIKSKIDKSS